MNIAAKLIRITNVCLFGIFLLTTFLSSCTIQYQLSRNFEQSNDSISVLVVGTNALQKSSAIILRLYPQFDQLSPELKDTAWKHHTKLLNDATDSIMLDEYYRSIIEQIKKTNIKIYDDSHTDDFMKQSGTKWIFRIAQLQLEEDKQQVDFSTEIKEQEELYKNMEIEVLSMNVWFEVFQSENDTTPFKVLYAEKKISDQVDGRFFSTDEKDKYQFRYNRTDLTKDDLPKLARKAGEQNGQQILDFLFNQYIKRFYPEAEQYYGFDIDHKSVYQPEEKLQFIEMK